MLFDVGAMFSELLEVVGAGGVEYWGVLGWKKERIDG